MCAPVRSSGDCGVHATTFARADLGGALGDCVPGVTSKTNGRGKSWARERSGRQVG
jgi:hypothetical protein